MTNSAHILIVDDHEDIRELVAGLLAKEGYRVTAAADGRQAQRLLRTHPIDLVVLDVMLPGEDGLSICRKLRASSDVPIIMLTAKGEEFDKVLGLEMGADDYLAKPFGSRELIARIRAVLRRASALPPRASLAHRGRWVFDRWTLDADTRCLKSDRDVSVALSSAEFSLLLAFVERPQIVLTRDQLIDLTSGHGADLVDRSIDTRISRLRQKIEHDPRNPQIIKTVWGGGYLFAASVTHT